MGRLTNDWYAATSVIDALAIHAPASTSSGGDAFQRHLVDARHQQQSATRHSERSPVEPAAPSGRADSEPPSHAKIAESSGDRAESSVASSEPHEEQAAVEESKQSVEEPSGDEAPEGTTPPDAATISVAQSAASAATIVVTPDAEAALAILADPTAESPKKPRPKVEAKPENANQAHPGATLENATSKQAVSAAPMLLSQAAQQATVQHKPTTNESLQQVELIETKGDATGDKPASTPEIPHPQAQDAAVNVAATEKAAPSESPSFEETTASVKSVGALGASEPNAPAPARRGREETSSASQATSDASAAKATAAETAPAETPSVTDITNPETAKPAAGNDAAPPQTDTSSRMATEAAGNGALTAQAPKGLAASIAGNSHHRSSHTAEISEADRSRFVQRVARAFQSVGEDGGQLRLRLSPPELGSMRLEITVNKGVLAAHVEAETPQARQLLLDNLPALRERLQEQNIKVERFDVDVAGQSSGGWSHQSAREQQQEQFQRQENLRRAATSHAEPSGPIGPRAHPSASDGQLNVVI
jgi:flagellar hook-length control protein FliK